MSKILQRVRSWSAETRKGWPLQSEPFQVWPLYSQSLQSRWAWDLWKSHALESLGKVPYRAGPVPLERKAASQPLSRNGLQSIHASDGALLQVGTNPVQLPVHLLHPRGCEPHIVWNEIPDRSPQKLGEALKARSISQSLGAEDPKQLDAKTPVLSLTQQVRSALSFLWMVLVCL